MPFCMHLDVTKLHVGLNMHDFVNTAVGSDG